MMRDRGALALCMVLCWCAAQARAETLIEVWRSPFGVPRSVSVDRNNGTCWTATGCSVMHIDQDGAILSQTDGFWNPESVSANPTDGSCWIADTANGRVVQLDAGGSELWHSPPLPRPVSVSVYPLNGSCWVAAEGVLLFGPDRTVRWQSDDMQNAFCVAVDPIRGNCWASHMARPPDVPWLRAAVTLLGPDGTELWRSFDLGQVGALAVDPTDGSCWLVSDGGTVVRVSSSGAVLWQSGDAYSGGGVTDICVNAADRSCWLGTDGASQQLIHLAPDGTEVARLTAGNRGVLSLGVDPGDGSSWVGLGGTDEGGEIVHLTDDGVELWRSDPPAARTVSADPIYGSCWVANDLTSEVAHLSLDGVELWRGGGFDHPVSVSVNPADGSCWVGERGHRNEITDKQENAAVTLLSPDGTQSWRNAGFVGVVSVSANPADGSGWVSDRGPQSGGGYFDGIVARLGQDGTELWRGGAFDFPRSVSVNRADSSCWVADWSAGQVVHLGQDGAELWRGGDLMEPTCVAADSNDGSCWVTDTKTNDPQAGRVLHLAANGTEISRNAVFDTPNCVAVDPSDGSCWVTDYLDPRDWDMANLVHLTGGGDELSRVGGLGEDAWVSCGATEDAIWVADAYNGQAVRFRKWFDDVPKSHWAFDAILACVEADIVAGYDDDRYRPGVIVTRDQMAVYLARALTGGQDNVPPGPAMATFEDVPAGYWAYDHVEYCHDQNVVQGYTATTYEPTVQVKRDQMAVYVARAMVAPTGEAALVDYVPADPRDFPDVPSTGYGDDGTEPFWAYKHIEYCVEHGVVQGYDDGYYHPEVAVTRDQMAVYVARAFGL